jgi:hypothetical protein
MYMKIHKIHFLIYFTCMIGLIVSCQPSPNKLNNQKTPTISNRPSIGTIAPTNAISTTQPTVMRETPESVSPTNNRTSIFISPSPPPIRTSTKTPGIAWQKALLPGQYLLYWVLDSPTSFSIYAKSRDGTRDYRLMAGLTGIGAISTDHERMVYLYGEIGSLNFKLVVQNLEDGTITEIPNGEYCNQPSWSPDGSKIVASCQGEIWVISLSTGDSIRVTNWTEPIDQARWSMPIWSPDGKWIAYLNRPDIHIYPSSGLYVTDASCLSDETTCPSKTIGPFTQALYPPFAWSPDSQYLVTSLKTSISILDFKSNTYREIFKVEHGYLPQSIAWSPDGEYIAFDIFERDLYIVRAKNGDVVYHDPSFYNMVLTWIIIPHPWVSGDIYSITKAGANLNLRGSPTLGGIVLRKLQPGNKVTILSGPREADGYTWWQMQSQDGTIGWAVNIPEWYTAVEVKITVTPTR